MGKRSRDKTPTLLGRLLVPLTVIVVCALGLEVAMRLSSLGVVRERTRLRMWGHFYAANPPLFYRLARLRSDGSTYLELDLGPNDPHSPDHRTQRYSMKKPPGVFRIVCVGDSLTEEWPVPGYENYTDRLQRLVAAELPPGAKVEVIPLGVGGYTTYQEAEHFERYFAELEMDVLVVQYCHNDVDVVHCDDCAADADARRDLDAQKLHVVQERRLLANPPGFFSSRLLLRGRHVLVHALGGQARVPHLELVPEGDEHRRGFATLKASAARRGVPILVVQFPRMQTGDPQPELRYSRRVIDDLALPVLDLTADLERVAPLERLSIGDGYHPNADGYAVAARSILERLRAMHALGR